LSLTYQARHTEAIAEIKRALDLDPYSLVINRNLGTTYYYARRYDEALEQLKKTAEMDPDFSMTHSVLGLTYAEKGLFQEAEQAFRKETSLPDRLREGFVYYCDARTGDREKLRRFLEQNIRMLAMAPPYWVAFFYAELKEADKVFEWLDKAYETGDGWICHLKVSPCFDDLRSDPRYKIMLEKIGLEK
jgi:tetratricopeptide (TPR) repeat protein